MPQVKGKREADREPNKLDVALGLRIRQRRKSLGVSQSALAISIGITFHQIQKYELGFNRVSFSRLVDIADALKCRVIDLIGDLDDESIPTPLLRQDTANLRESGAPELLAPTPRQIAVRLCRKCKCSANRCRILREILVKSHGLRALRQFEIRRGLTRTSPKARCSCMLSGKQGAPNGQCGAW